MTGGEAVGKCLVMLGLEVGMPGRVAMVNTGTTLGNSTWLIGLW